MALRFRKSFKLAPGVRMNLSGSGASWSLGPRGARVNIGKRGTYLSSSIPGTGLSSRQRIGGPAPRKPRQQAPQQQIQSVPVTVVVSDDGTILFKDSNGDELPSNVIKAAKKQHGDAIKELIQKKCDEINQEIESVGELHLDTPSPDAKPGYVGLQFEIPQPIAPRLKRLNFFLSLFKSQREKAELKNNAAMAEHQVQLREWESQKSEFENHERRRRWLIEEGIYEDLEAMSEFLELTLQEIVWPRETDVSTELFNSGRVVFIDVDFPEIEDMPKEKAAIPASGFKLSVKEMSSTTIQKLYMQHIHAIAFRTIGEAFYAQPKSEEVVFSGYSQRPDKTTGRITDQYLLSVRVKRSQWARIAFENLEAIDIVEALAAFDLKRSMTKTGVFKPIEPYSPSELN